MRGFAVVCGVCGTEEHHVYTLMTDRCAADNTAEVTCFNKNGHIKTGEQRTIIQQSADRYTGR